MSTLYWVRHPSRQAFLSPNWTACQVFAGTHIRLTAKRNTARSTPMGETANAWVPAAWVGCLRAPPSGPAATLITCGTTFFTYGRAIESASSPTDQSEPPSHVPDMGPPLFPLLFTYAFVLFKVVGLAPFSFPNFTLSESPLLHPSL